MRKKKVKSQGIFGAFLTFLFSVPLVVSGELSILLLFVHALNVNVRIPAIGAISGDCLGEFFDSWFSLFFSGILVLIPLLLLILINTHRVRRVFASVGASSLITAIVSMFFGLLGTQTIKLFSGDWQDILIHVTAVFQDYSVICAMILTAIGATCLSIYFCIAVIKGATHEKNT